MEITKIKFDKNLTTVWYTKSDGTTTTESKVSCEEPRDPAFTKEADKLLPHMIEILELPSTWQYDDLTVTGVEFQHGDIGIGCAVNFYKKFPKFKSPLNINTPYVVAVLHSKELEHTLHRLQEHAAAFISGKREQADLFSKIEMTVIHGE